MLVKTLKDIKAREIVPGFLGRFIHSENMTVAYWEITAGSLLPEHTHHHEQIVNVIEGILELTVENRIYKLEPGSVVVIPPNIPHSGKSITECNVIDIFYPVREDYK